MLLLMVCDNLEGITQYPEYREEKTAYETFLPM